MGIKLKNLDLRTEGMQRYAQTTIRVRQSEIIFVAPCACRVDSFYLAGTGTPYTDTTASAIGQTASVRNVVTSDYLVNVGWTSGTTPTISDVFTGLTKEYKITANNSLSTGTPIQFAYGYGGQGEITAVICMVKYTPLLHKETR